MTTTRRRFIEILPISAFTLGLGACGDQKAADPGATSAPTAPPPAAVPAAPTAAPNPAPSPGATADTPPTTPGGTAATGAGVVDEKEPQAVAVGYVTDATRADKAKFPQFESSQRCANCALFKATAEAPAGPCALFGDRQVAGAGWCSAWTKRAA